MRAYLFPGQGSQSKGMGETLFDELPEFAPLEADIDDLLGYSIRELCLADPDGKLRQTQYTQPALYVVNALYAMQKQAETGWQPDFVAGHSLGEYNALLAAGAFDFMTGLRLVQKRGELMAEVEEGGMAAVVGLSVEEIRTCLAAEGVTSLDLANHNSPQQTVLSGPKTDIEAVAAAFEAAGARLYQPLQVSAPFHSRYMKETAKHFAEFLQGFELNPLRLPVVANLTGRPYPAEASSDTVKEMLVQQIDHPVQWSECVRYLLAKGVTEFEEVGPGAVLTGLTRRIQREAPPLNLKEDELERGTPAEEESTREQISAHEADDFQEIEGVGQETAALLAEKGVTTFAQLAALGKSQLDDWLQKAGWPTANTESWIEQAHRLAGAAETAAEVQTKPNESEAASASGVEAPEEHCEQPLDPIMADLDALDETPSYVPPGNGTAPGEGPFFGAITPESLGDAAFKADYGLQYAYIAGAMYKGIASKELVVAMGKARMIGYLGTGGMTLDEIEADVRYIQTELANGEPYGMNLLCNLVEPAVEGQTVDLFLRHGIRYVEAAAYMQMTPSLVRYRLHGIQRQPDGTVTVPNYVLAKVSRPEVATLFMQPAPQRILDKLLASGQITAEEAELSRFVPMSEDICVEADSGGHTDQGVAYALMPAMLKLRDEVTREHNYAKSIRVGAAGGIGTPEAAAAAFVLGAEFILTGSINQCTVEAGTSDAVKEMLQGINVQDTAYAPAGDMFELGAKVQVLRRGVFFHARANKLYALYQQYNSLDEIDAATRRQIQEKYFKRTFDEVWAETRAYYERTQPEEVTRAEQNPKHKMALIFRWYFVHTTRLAMSGSVEQRVDYQVHCGPAQGAFNQWVKGTDLEDWRNRHVDQIGLKLMQETADMLNRRFAALSQNGTSRSEVEENQASGNGARAIA